MSALPPIATSNATYGMSVRAKAGPGRRERPLKLWVTLARSFCDASVIRSVSCHADVVVIRTGGGLRSISVVCGVWRQLERRFKLRLQDIAAMYGHSQRHRRLLRA